MLDRLKLKKLSADINKVSLDNRRFPDRIKGAVRDVISDFLSDIESVDDLIDELENEAEETQDMELIGLAQILRENC